MSRSNSLRKLIKSKLKSIYSDVYYGVADNDALYPHAVFELRNINTGDMTRCDYSLQIDLWDKSDSMADILEKADEVEDLLKSQNLPQDDILPTIYAENRVEVPDDDRKIRHIKIDMVVQLYELEVE